MSAKWFLSHGGSGKQARSVIDGLEADVVTLALAYDLVTQRLAKDRFDIVTPSVSILAEPPVAIVDRVVDKGGSREVAQAYLQFLYDEIGQEIAARHFYRPRLAMVAAKHVQQFQQVSLFTIEEVFGGWQKAQQTHFGDGGVFDRIYQPGR